MYIVIMGGGKVGEYLASVLLGQGHQVAVIEQDRRTADRLSMNLTGDYLIICGDGCDSDYLEDAGVRKADVLAAVTGHDDANLVSCELATQIFKVPRCIARVNNPKNRRVFREVGIESVSSTMLIANMIEEEAMMGSVGVVSALSRGDVVLIEAAIPRNPRRFDPKRGLLAARIKMPRGSALVAIDRKEYSNAEIVTSETVLRPGDKAVILAECDSIEAARALFASL